MYFPLKRQILFCFFWFCNSVCVAASVTAILDEPSSTLSGVQSCGPYFWSRKLFVNKLRELLDRSDVKCEIKDIYIGEVSIAEIMVEDETYLAIDCIVRENEKEDWRMDTVFIPTKYIKYDNDDTNFIKGVKFLSKQVEKQNVVLN